MLPKYFITLSIHEFHNRSMSQRNLTFSSTSPFIFSTSLNRPQNSTTTRLAKVITCGPQNRDIQNLLQLFSKYSQYNQFTSSNDTRKKHGQKNRPIGRNYKVSEFLHPYKRTIVLPHRYIYIMQMRKHGDQISG